MFIYLCIIYGYFQMLQNYDIMTVCSINPQNLNIDKRICQPLS